jgi:thioesterase DpgC
VAEPPELVGDFDRDSRALTDFVLAGEEALASLPARTERADDQQLAADEIHRTARWLRGRFLDRHAERLYDELTAGRTRWLRLADIAYTAAAVVPGLAPTREQIADEAGRPQPAKEGREIDQGILFQRLLRSPEIGSHIVDSMLRPTDRALRLAPEFRATGRLDLGKVLLERRDGVAWLTVRNLECLNAEDNELTADMETAVDLTQLDDGVSVGVLRGGEMTHPRYLGRRVFSAGINLKHLHAGRISFVDFLLGRELGFISKVMRGVLLDDEPATWPGTRVAKPWVAGVDTFAIGGGMQLLLVFDHVVAASDAYFSLPAAQEGIVPGLGNLRLTRAVGARIARQVVLGGRRIWASEPDGRLIADEVVDPSDMDLAVERAAAMLAAPAVGPNRRMLNVADEPVDVFRGYLSEFAMTQALRLYSADVLGKVARFGAAPKTS